MPERRQQLDHLRKDTWIRGDDPPAVKKRPFTIEIADQPARLDDEQATGRDIPGIQAYFPKAVVITGGHVREVERCRAGTANAGGLEGHRLEHPHIHVEVAAVTEREA